MDDEEMSVRTRPRAIVEHTIQITDDGESPVAALDVDEVIYALFNELLNYGLICTDNRVTIKNMFVNMIRVFDNKNRISDCYVLPLNHVYVQLLQDNYELPHYRDSIQYVGSEFGRDKRMVMVSASAVDALVTVMASDINEMLAKRASLNKDIRNCDNGSLDDECVLELNVNKKGQ